MIYLTDYSTSQYAKKLEQSYEKKAMKITKVVETITKVRKLNNIAKIVYFSVSLLFLYYFLYYLKKPYLNNKNQ